MAQLSRLHDLKCFSLTHFNPVNMLQQVANFSGMASPRYLHIKRVGGRPHLRVLGVAGNCASSSRGTPGFVRGGGGHGPRWGPERRIAGGWGPVPQGGDNPPSEHAPLRPPPVHLPETPPSYPGEGAPPVPQARKGRARIYPQVRLLNRVWRWMDVDTREEIVALS